MSAKLKRERNRILLALAVFSLILIAEKTGAVPLLNNKAALFFCFLIPYLICGLPVLRKAAHGIRNRQMFDESFLMTIASIGAFATGEYEEAAAVMLFYQVGEWFQSYAVGKSRQSITELMDIAPEYANVEREDGSTEEVDPDDVEVGDVLVIRPGEKIPVDAEVISGESFVNTAALTGEPVPRPARPGETVISGCINGEGLIRVRALKAYEDSTVAKILELVENASEKKSRTETFITRFARYYTPIVVCAALVLAIVPSLIAGNWMTWIYRACTFLVISCPCALVISVPLAFFGGIGAASRCGVLVKGSNYLELLADLDTLVTDKTGTLTEGVFKVTEVIPAEGVSGDTVLREAAAAEGQSTHPIAGSIRDALSEGTETAEPLLESENMAGMGLLSTFRDRIIAVGNAALMSQLYVSVPRLEDAAATVCYVARAKVEEEGLAEKDAYEYLGAILIRDVVKEKAGDVIRELKRSGVREVVMLTGDRKSVGEAVGSRLGVTGVYAELLPEDKVKKVEELLLKTNGRSHLASVGDGINDAPVLMRADVGIAMGSMGSDAAIEAADIVIMDDDLMRIPAVIRIAGRTISIARQNIVFALFVKALILILGAFGIANMWAAVFADVGVAVLCILNSMRLIFAKPKVR
ncbi:MAG: heavy metal translocating P-type ATPase [Lachnospiraceae bacterium]|nr:heavy metal translocating P-type ATPase [Lachnospiraceae bacterium]